RKLLYSVGNWFTTMIFNREALLNIGGFDDSLGGLSDFFAATVLAGRHGAVFSPSPLRMLRLHDNSVLSRTLSNNEAFAAVIRRFRETGTEIAPEVFTSRMLARTELRINFASLRASQGTTSPFVVTRLGKLRSVAVRLLAKTLRLKVRQPSLAMMFVIMRP